MRIFRIAGKIPKGVPKANTGGDCFQAAAKFVLDEAMRGNKGVMLVHGMVTGQGPISGIRYVHGWAEDGDMAIDRSRGRDIRVPTAVYYAIGNISDTVRYTADQARDKMLESGTYGPWDIQSEY